jgi:predicted thioesterase
MTEKCFKQSITVSENQTAAKIGSGLLPVFSTPSMIALMENTAMQLIDLQPGQSSVGVSICADHLKASPIGAKLECISKLIETDGRKYTFEIEVFDESASLIGKASHVRFVIDVEKFMSKLK